MQILNLKKVYYKWHNDNDPVLLPTPSNQMQEFALGWVQHDCEEQNFDKLEGNEQIIITVSKIPFIRFRIMLTPEGKYHLASISPISLRTYTEQQYRVERWGDFESVSECVGKAVSVVAGFINRMGKEEINDGNYYKD